MSSQNITKKDEGTPAATAFTVSAQKLRRMLTAVLPHVCQDDTLPALTGVKVEVAAGVLYLVATDRFTLGVAREALPGAAASPVPDAAFLLPAEAAWALRRMLKGAEGVAALAVADGRLTADAGGNLTASWPLGAVEDLVITWKWRTMVRKAVTAPACEMGDGFGLDSRMLRRFALDRRPSWAEPVNLRIINNSTGEKVNPLLTVTRGEWFIGLQMPVRHVVQEAYASRARDLWTAATEPEQKPEAA